MHQSFEDFYDAPVAIRPFRIRHIFHSLIAVMFLLLIVPPSAEALTSDEILVVTNWRVPGGLELARYYMKKRGVPAKNLLEVTTSKAEDISREAYEKQIESPVRDYLTKHDPEGKKLKCLLLMYGMPLRIWQVQGTREEQKRLHELHARETEANEKMKGLDKQDEKHRKALQEELKQVREEIAAVDGSFTGASVDSELTLALEKGHGLRGWLPNKYYIPFMRKPVPGTPGKVLLVSRLDGPSEDVVRRIIDDSLETEKSGLSGNAYFDARWPPKKDKTDSAYLNYDRAIHNAAAIVRKSNLMPVVTDDRAELFQPGEAPDAALYCGWYSLGKYVDAFTWKRGAVGYHVASSECTTLKKKDSRVWCKAMLEKGVAATVGPVAEPYLQSFPAPEIFFGCLIDGRLTLAECYAVSTPFLSWQMVLIGDPLYRPFKNRRHTRIGPVR